MKKRFSAGFTPLEIFGKKIFSKIFYAVHYRVVERKNRKSAMKHSIIHRRLLTGFTLIELLIVVAIIGILAGILFVSIGQSPLQKSRDSRRKDALKQLQLALELYASDNNGNYPITGGWYSSEPGDNVTDNGGNYIPGLAPTYIAALPRNPQGASACVGSLWIPAYLYRSPDGKNYSLLSHCAAETGYSSSDPFYDPIRPTWAWKVCGGENVSVVCDV